MRRYLTIIGILLSLQAGGLLHAEEKHPQVYRTFMPEAGPSAFAVVLSPDLALCYDPLRGGVNQAWRGSVDLKPTLQAKINQEAAINGTVFYREATLQPLRINDAGKVPERRFKGYRYLKDKVVFDYTLDGVAVSEMLRVSEHGKVLERHWRVPQGTTLFFVSEAQPNADVTFENATEISPGLWKMSAEADVSFFMKIQAR